MRFGDVGDVSSEPIEEFRGRWPRVFIAVSGVGRGGVSRAAKEEEGRTRDNGADVRDWVEVLPGVGSVHVNVGDNGAGGVKGIGGSASISKVCLV